MIHKLIFTFTIILAGGAYAGDQCAINFHDRIFFAESKERISYSDLIKRSDCDKMALIKITNEIKKYQGNTINLEYLQNASPELFQELKVQITPDIIHILPLERFLKEALTLPPNWEIRNAKLLSGRHSFALSSLDNSSVRCNNCDSLGNKNIEVAIQASENNSWETEWISLSLLAKASALVSQSFLAVNQQPLSENLFAIKEIETANPERLFTSIEQLKYYKLNRPLSQNAPLQANDLTPVTLVANGKIAQLVFNNGNCSLTGSALPMQSGKFGDLIQLRNLKSNKVFVGKVIDYNKVVVTL